MGTGFIAYGCFGAKFNPVTAIQNNLEAIKFEFPRLDAPDVYLIQQTVLRVQCIIQKKAGTLPDTNCRVASINFTSLFAILGIYSCGVKMTLKV